MKNGNHAEINEKDFKKFIGLEGDQLFELAYLSGCDVQPNSLMSVKDAVGRLRFYGSLRGIYKMHPEIVSKEHIEKYENLKKVLTS